MFRFFQVANSKKENKKREKRLDDVGEESDVAR